MLPPNELKATQLGGAESPFQNNIKRTNYTSDFAQLKLNDVTAYFPYYLLSNKPQLKQTLLAMAREI